MYQIRFEKRAQKALVKLPKAVQQRIGKAIDGLAETPRPKGVKKMSGYQDRWRIRVGDYRVVYEIEDDKLLVLVLRVGNRGEVYKR
ncbi:MAG: type II toxin-antitoxin system RelE/ParE family toxin [Candidatus Dadabacteria bacterium]|nr:MAG: type II toxin-antitoxin system RelE/ParE family toxin [Candidatus Dadabacteria bacterium]